MMAQDVGRSPSGRAAAADAVEPVPVSSKADIPNAVAAIRALSSYICFSAFSASEPLSIRFDFTCADDRIAAADALDEAFAALDDQVSA
jgi:hypothetical protein